MTLTSPPRARTAIAAGVLAVLGGTWFLAGIVWFSFLYRDGGQNLLVPGQIADGVIGLLLVLGGVSVLARAEAGRVLCLVAAALALVAPLVGEVLLYQRILFIVGGPTGIDPLLPRRIVVAAPFVALLVLAALPATRRWTRR